MTHTFPHKTSSSKRKDDERYEEPHILISATHRNPTDSLSSTPSTLATGHLAFQNAYQKTDGDSSGQKA